MLPLLDKAPFVVLSSRLSNNVMKQNSKCHVGANYVFFFFFLSSLVDVINLTQMLAQLHVSEILYLRSASADVATC